MSDILEEQLVLCGQNFFSWLQNFLLKQTRLKKKGMVPFFEGQVRIIIIL